MTTSRIVVRSILALCIALILAAAISYADAGAPMRVVVFGDSITEGGALPKEQRAQAWVTLVQKQAGDRLRLINEGKGGRPTNSAKEFETMLARRPEADCLVLALGTNDSRDISEECVPKAVANLRSMITRAREFYGARLRVIIVGPPNIRKDALGPTRPIADQREAKLKELGAGFASLAKELGCEFVSLYGVIPESSLAKDGVHPDAAGNAAIAEVMLPKLLSLSR